MDIWRSLAQPMPQEVMAHPRWLIAIGVLMIALGLAAVTSVLWASIAVGYVLGAAFLAGGLLQLIHAVGMRSESSSMVWTLSGTVYVVAALPLMLDPAFGATVLAVCVALALGISGLSRVVIGLRYRHGRGRIEMLVTGLAAISLAGLAMGLIWYFYAMWVLGLILAADLLAQGAAFLVVGLKRDWPMRSASPAATS